MIQDLLSALFPPKIPEGFHPQDDMPGILGYQYRLVRSRGEMPSVDRTRVEAVRIRRIIEGEYVNPWPETMLHYTDGERPLVAVYPLRFGEPTQEQISSRELEKLNA